MRSLQSRVFLSCLVVLLASLVAFLALSMTVGTRIQRERLRSVRQIQAEHAIFILETQGRDKLAGYLASLDNRFQSRHVLLTPSGIDLATQRDESALLAEAFDQTSFGWRENFEVVFGLRRTGRDLSPDGKYVWLLHKPKGSRPWFDPFALLPYSVPALLLMALLYSSIAFRVAASIKGISTVAERFGRGDLRARVRSRRRDEIGDLARSFDAMADRVEVLLTSERRLLQDVSHELRSPLTRLGVALELAGTEENRPKAIVRAQRQLESLNGLVKSLLTVTAVEVDRPAQQAEAIHLDHLIDTVIDDCSLETQSKGCRFHVRCAEQAAVFGERELLARALDNVIRNAIHYSPRGADIDVTLSALNGDASIAVRDYGPGVPADSLPKLFDPFYRVDQSRDHATGGVGLGLSIVRRLVEMHGGSVSARNSEPGLVVTLTLPCAIESTQPAAQTLAS